MAGRNLFETIFFDSAFQIPVTETAESRPVISGIDNIDAVFLRLRGCFCHRVPERFRLPVKMSLCVAIARVFIPKENMLDLKDAAQEVKDKIEIVPVSNVTEILAETGIQN